MRGLLEKTLDSLDYYFSCFFCFGIFNFNWVLNFWHAIKKFSQITVGSIICGRAKIGERCWIAPNSIIDTGCEIGNDCFVGVSSFVNKNFSENSVVVGTPAKLLKKNHNSTSAQVNAALIFLIAFSIFSIELT